MYQNFLIPFCRCALTGLLFLVVSIGGFSQQQSKIDSLTLALENKPASGKCSTLIELSIEYVNADLNKALSFADESFRCSLDYGDSATLVRSGRIKGQILRRMDKLKESITMFQEVLPIAKRNGFGKDYKMILNSLAVAYTFQGNFDNALRYHFESLVIREEEGDKEGTSVSLNNIGLVYYKIKNYERALEYYQKSLKLKEEIGDKFDLDLLLINIGVTYVQLADYKSSKEYIKRAFDLCGAKCKDEIYLFGKNGLAMAHFGLKDFANAELYFKESLQLSIKSDNKRYQAENLLYLGKVALKLGNLDEAIRYFKDTEKLTETINYVDVKLDVYKYLAEALISKNDFKNASHYQTNYTLLKDSIYNDQLIKNLATVQSNYEERENLKTIKDKDAVLKLKEDLIQRQKSQYAFVIIIMFLIVGLAGVLYWANSRQRKSNKDLASAKNEIEEKNRELAQKNLDLDRQVIERTEELNLANESLKQVNSELDNFIYKTSHDIRGPLATLKGMCNLAIMEINEPLALDYLKKLDFTAEKMNTILTRLLIINQINSSILNPTMIDFKHITEEILMLERKKGLPENFSFSYHIEPGVILISDQDLVRIVLENLIDNAIKYFTDSRNITPFVKITVSKADGYATVRVLDNGIGINQKDRKQVFQMFMRASERSETGGVGLYLAKLATEKLGGEIILEESNEKGSQFFAKFPEDLNIIIAKREEEERRRHQKLQAIEDSKSQLKSLQPS